MKTRLLCAVAWSFCATVCLAKDTNNDKGFTCLFNGKDLGGWVIEGETEGWQVKDGLIRSEGEQGGHWLRSEKQYDNFIFQVEWRISEGGNSGVYIRSTAENDPWETGYEIQISNAPRDDLHCTGSLYGHAAVRPRPDESANTWHRFEIHCQRHHITIFADGVQCVDFDQSTSSTAKDKPLKGYVGLQDAHAAAGNYIEYRHVSIKVLD